MLKILFVLSMLGAPTAQAQDTHEFRVVAVFGSAGDKPGEFMRPEGVGVDRFGRIVVADTQNHRLQWCDTEGACSTLGSMGGEPGEFLRPRGVWMDLRPETTETAFVADGGNDRIQNCSLNGVCSVVPAMLNFNDPWDVVVDDQGRIIVADTFNHRIRICAADGNCSTFGRLGAQVGAFERPAGVAVLGDRIVVADRLNNRIQLCSYNGQCTAFGGFGVSWGKFNSPSDVAITRDGWIVVADTGNHRIQLCSEDGRCQDFGRFGSEPGNFWDPIGVAVDANNRIVIADSGNNRVQIIARHGGSVPMNVGMNDNWFNPAMAGQGLFVDVLTELNQVFVMWFTFDSERPDDSVSAKLGGPGQRWYSAQGPINADNVAELDVILTSGGVFNQTMPKPTASRVGKATLRFINCKEAEFSWQLDSPTNAGQQQVQRITLDNVALCEYFAQRGGSASLAIDRFAASQQAVERGDWVELSWSASGAEHCLPGRGVGGWSDNPIDPDGGSAWVLMEEDGRHEFTLECTDGVYTALSKAFVQVGNTEAESGLTINEGLSGNWFNPEMSGHGIFVTVWPGLKQLYVGWFTYDTERPPEGTPATIGEPGHRWLTAQGNYSGNSAELSLVNTTGGVFNATEPKVTNAYYGTLSLEFHSCTQATMRWEIPGINDTGEIQFQRLTNDNVALCEALSGPSGGSSEPGFEQD